ncbi:hypothetical protein PPL_08220 [Heterostelium album PN500]|uniref:DUF5050 domain-containing protein n=1 Tax=Heterostelium pallidum (strain ATCC 26659 / Pp 5 / PN500) TaxID=670386 RepID=D3BIY5_HETP5|nr:hypothetical protein PPL_08220 [Heterostelium album PN500]EFA78759.1 hypothetical protein PPL_08220 [Heterostelium album PN500]|eukprot:XP_020430883.1 hypothetical protein PPL_08220 [Heterostelium album PN500]
MVSYIFHTYAEGISLIDTINNTIEELNIKNCFFASYESMILVGDYIYIIGGWHNRKKWYKFSIQSKSIEYTGDIEGIEIGDYVSICYDGKDYIYLVNGYESTSYNIEDRLNIDRFNINTMIFERYHQLSNHYKRQISTMIFNNNLYSLAFNNKRMLFKLDLTSQTVTDIEIDINTRTACYDDKGNFYIHSKHNNRFIRFNVETNQTTNLISLPEKEGDVFLMYHRMSPTSNYIYSFGGVDYGNFRYSIETDQIEPYHTDLPYHSYWYGSLSIPY